MRFDTDLTIVRFDIDHKCLKKYVKYLYKFNNDTINNKQVSIRRERSLSTILVLLTFSSSRNFLKQQQSFIWNMIKDVVYINHLSVSLIKVRSHSKNFYNDLYIIYIWSHHVIS